jgi:hypothetical protein
VTLRNYQPVAWVLYQRVMDQSKADIFIKPGISIFAHCEMQISNKSPVPLLEFISMFNVE